MINAKVICDSVSPSGERLTTVEVEFHRFILPELNTHRVFSRNYQSSRAVPVQKMIDQVRDNPAIPVHWGKNQAGMVADEESDTKVFLSAFGGAHEWDYTSEEAWKVSARCVADAAGDFHLAGYHKQIVNRLLEPFMWTKGVITADQKGWESFFALRCHPDAQPEIQALAYKIQEAMEKSEPRKLEYGQWHLPYIEWDSFKGGDQYVLNDKDGYTYKITLEEAIKVSTSCTAQVSYRRLDDSLEKAEKIYEMLNLPEGCEYKDDPPHFSPAEHVAKCVESSIVTLDENYTGNTHEVVTQDCSGNFNCGEFLQYRKALEIGIEKELINGS